MAALAPCSIGLTASLIGGFGQQWFGPKVWALPNIDDLGWRQDPFEGATGRFGITWMPGAYAYQTDEASDSTC